ncbi:TetR family transcriptional regulator [Nocardioides sp. NPDC006273]|uniref:TetR/AcrR family transcriptional regulator n=1 Tax=Nocardioides sp. NPDC006273 TaxID=3155598 RepID=UPI0033A23131
MSDPTPTAPERALPLRERKKLQVRRNLVETALRLFRADGFHQTTLEKLVDEAEVSTRTFFRYFESKESVAMAAEDELWEAFLARVVSEELEGPVLEWLRTAMLTALERMDDGWERRFLATRGLAARTPELRAYSALQTTKVQQQLADELEDAFDIDHANQLELRLACEFALSAWRCGAKNWVREERHQPEVGPRAELIERLREAFDAIPRAITYAAR